MERDTTIQSDRVCEWTKLVNFARCRVRAIVFRCLLATITQGLFVAAISADEATGGDQYWFQWRGPLGTGVAPSADPPLKWSETKNLRWKIALPGKGHSTPIIAGDRVFVTAAIPYGDELEPKYSDRPGAHDNLPVTRCHEFVVLAIDRADGQVIWQKSVHRALPHEGGHFTASLASNSPVTDGELLFAFFGSYGLYCLDFEGNVQWQTKLGQMHSKHGHGEGSSPAVHGETLVVNWDHEEQSFLVAFNKRTGDELWRVARDEVTSWATPIIVEHNGTVQLVVSGTDRVRSYALATGEVLWQCGGLSANIVASPVAASGMVFAGSSYEKRAMLAIRLDGAEGDITETNRVAWTRTVGTPYVPSPLLYGDSIYFLRHYQGILSRVNIKTGLDDGGPFRLGTIRDVYASPVAAAGRIYITDRDGTTQVISHDANPQVLGVNQLNDSFSASAALVGHEIVLRGERYLYCIAEE